MIEWYHDNSHNDTNDPTHTTPTNHINSNNILSQEDSHIHYEKRIQPATKYHKYFRALGRCDDTMNLGGIKGE